MSQAVRKILRVLSTDVRSLAQLIDEPNKLGESLGLTSEEIAALNDADNISPVKSAVHPRTRKVAPSSGVET